MYYKIREYFLFKTSDKLCFKNIACMKMFNFDINCKHFFRFSSNDKLKNSIELKFCAQNFHEILNSVKGALIRKE